MNAIEKMAQTVVRNGESGLSILISALTDHPLLCPKHVGLGDGKRCISSCRKCWDKAFTSRYPELQVDLGISEKAQKDIDEMFADGGNEKQ